MAAEDGRSSSYQDTNPSISVFAVRPHKAATRRPGVHSQAEQSQDVPLLEELRPRLLLKISSIHQKTKAKAVSPIKSVSS